MRSLFSKKHIFIITAVFACFFMLSPNTAHAWFGIGDTIQDLIRGITSTLFFIPLSFSSFILWVAGSLFNFVIKYTIVDLRQNLDALKGITVAWKVIRDLANISFIFVLLYAAIGTILETEKNWKKIVISVVTAAVLINFSMFFTRLLIDFSNIISLLFYRTLVTASGGDLGIAGTLMQPLGLTTLFNVEDIATLFDEDMSLMNLVLTTIGGSIFLFITAFVFFAATLLFVVRYVNFIFLLILSPFAVLGRVFSSSTINKNIAMWWSTLMGQLIFAPVFMIMMWVVAAIIRTGGLPTVAPDGGVSGASLSGLFTKSGGSMDIVFNFILVIALVIAALITSKQIASNGSHAASKLVGNAAGFMVAKPLGWGGRKFIGSSGRKMADDTNLQERAANVGNKYSKSTQLAAIAKIKAGQKMASGSFDIRNSRFSEMGKSLGMGDLGIGGKAEGKGGYDAEQKKKAEEKKKFGDSLAPSAIQKDQAKIHLQNLENKRDEELKAGRRVSPELLREIEEAKERVDVLHGINEKEAESRNKKAMEAIVRTAEEDLDKKDKTHKDAKLEAEKLAKEALENSPEMQKVKAGIEKEQQIAESSLYDDDARAFAAAKAKELTEKYNRRFEELKSSHLLGDNSEKEYEEAKARYEEIKELTGDKKKKERDEYLREQNLHTKKSDSAGDIWKNAYAEHISNPAKVSRFSPHRTLFVGPISRSSLQAGAGLRKPGEKVEDVVKKLLKKTGELPDEDDKDTKGGDGGGDKPDAKTGDKSAK
jgi:hypothetical protein